MLSLLYLRLQAQQYFISLSYMVVDKKMVLKIWLNLGLNLTFFRGTGPRAPSVTLLPVRCHSVSCIPAFRASPLPKPQCFGHPLQKILDFVGKSKTFYRWIPLNIEIFSSILNEKWTKRMWGQDIFSAWTWLFLFSYHCMQFPCTKGQRNKPPSRKLRLRLSINLISILSMWVKT